jgi:hypothetical protein
MIRKFKLKSPEDDGSIESYVPKEKIIFINLKKDLLNTTLDTSIEGDKSPAEARNKSKSKAKNERFIYPNKLLLRENYKRYIKMRANPKAYFNFGFGPKEFALFLNKQYFMRVEKDLILKKTQRLEIRRKALNDIFFSNN